MNAKIKKSGDRVTSLPFETSQLMHCYVIYYTAGATVMNSSLFCNRFCEIVLNDETRVRTETCWEAPLSLEQHSIDTSLTTSPLPHWSWMCTYTLSISARCPSVQVQPCACMCVLFLLLPLGNTH